MATPSVVPVLTINSNDLPAVPPSAIVHQRANLTRTAGRPPRIPRGESVTRQKKNPSPIKEQQEETLLEKEIHITSKRRIKSKQGIIEDNVEVVIEQQNEILPDIIQQQVQSTPLRGKKKKILQEDINHIPQLEPPALPLSVPENEIIPKKTRVGRSKTKQVEEEVKPTRTASVRNRKKQQKEEEDIPPPPKKNTRNKKLIEPFVNTEEVNPPIITKVRATPSRGKKKSPLEIAEPIIPSTPKKTTTKSKKRKGNEDANENPIDTIQVRISFFFKLYLYFILISASISKTSWWS